MHLTKEQEKMLDGEQGEVAERMFRLLVRLGDIYGAEAAWVSGPFSTQAEYTRFDITQNDAPNPTAWGCYWSAGYFLTGEHRASRGEVVRKDVQLADHVVLPDHVLVDLALAHLVLERTVVLAVEEPLGVGADHLGAVGDVVQPVALDRPPRVEPGPRRPRARLTPGPSLVEPGAPPPRARRARRGAGPIRPADRRGSPA